jgi:predicted RNase H-like HicB family nuclease
MHRYGINIHWDDLDEVFIAEVPELPGCKAHGSTYEKAIVSAQEAIQLWIDTATEFGRKIPNRFDTMQRKTNRSASRNAITDYRVTTKKVVRSAEYGRCINHRTGRKIKNK